MDEVCPLSCGLFWELAVGDLGIDARLRPEVCSKLSRPLLFYELLVGDLAPLGTGILMPYFGDDIGIMLTSSRLPVPSSNDSWGTEPDHLSAGKTTASDCEESVTNYRPAGLSPPVKLSLPKVSS